MRPDQPPTIRLADYQPPSFTIPEVFLTVHLHPTRTKVTARLRIEPQSDDDDLVLDGVGLTLVSVALDNIPLDLSAVTVTASALRIDRSLLPDGPFALTTEVEINPEANTELEGLYLSNGIYTTQCEAEGFRRITYFPDRPDVMSRYTVRIESDAPVILSNGNPTDQGPGWAEWHDPWPKPCYLFALVAGDLVSLDDDFVTASGKPVDLRIWVRPGDRDKCAYAMDALKRSMRWDEEVYGREYDLDIFQIVAIDDFNAGAMENKGLNIFNAKYVLASPETATDRDYALIEGIIAHEYFHNWTGNRITCRDWFQLSLKEGLTVFRDQQFSGDMRSHAVQRINDVIALRARQFREDSGPLAHPVRPESYIEINNFYTATVYEKGAEVIRMLRSLVGDDGYDAALALYFDRHDGDAATIEDWLAAFEDATGRDLRQFKLWYSQAGTPQISASHRIEDSELVLTLTQTVPPTPGQVDKLPMLIPVSLGAIQRDGSPAIHPTMLELGAPSQTFRLALIAAAPNAPAAPVLSLNRGFSAPIELEYDVPPADLALLLAHDPDPFNRWQAGRSLALSSAVAMTRDDKAVPDPAFLDGMAAVLADPEADPAFKALALGLPSDEDVFDAARRAGDGVAPDPTAVHDARARLDLALARHVPDLETYLAAAQVPGPYSPDAAAAGQRALAGRLLGLLTRLDADATAAQALFARADNMTDALVSLGLLVRSGRAETALAGFYDRWKDDSQVTDKWFSVQASMTPPAQAVATVTALTTHPAFTWKTPNRFRALISAFATGNMAGFHSADGSGYRLLTDWLLTLDPLNPQTTARMAGVFETWRQFDEPRQALMLGQMQRIADAPGLSRNTGEVIGRILEARG